jgi:2-polyprenyl-3-methyl-5-hydroxy-6-metoxy-1,4-benzoquinol methylase
MTKFEYREIDKEGWETLDAIAGADKFNEWMYKTIRPYCSGRILEVGSGIGNISRYFIKENANITLSDIRPVYCEILSKEFPQAQGVIKLNLTHPQFDSVYQQQLSTYDSIFALNVVEHIEDDHLALKNCYKLLKPGGRVVILVPAYSWLYNRFDKELEHFRRYNRRSLNAKISAEGFSVVHSQYFNLMGIPGWYVSGKLQKNKTIPKSQMSLYNKLVPAFKIIDRIIMNKAGLSVISVGLK